MLMKFSCATFLTLTSIAGIDAFLAPASNPSVRLATFRSSTFENDDFKNALKGESGSPEENAESDEEVSQGSSRFKEMMESAQKTKADAPSSSVIQNPFLIPSPSPPPPTSASIPNLDSMSVEEQAALLRQMLSNQGNETPAIPAPLKEKRTDSAGRPTGRNNDADSIANSADLYFAQLKRDSSVRTMARYGGRDDVADAVMGDDGIDQLNDLLKQNPYLQGKLDEEKKLIDDIPEGALRPFFGSDELSEEEKTSSGISYKEILKQKRMKQNGGAAPATTPAESAPATVETQPEPVAPPPVPEPVVAHVQLAPPQQSSVTSSSDPSKQKLRTFMGMILKHRGGPGFGKGLLKGPEIDRFESLLVEITTMLREEAMESAPTDVPMMTVPPPAPVAVEPAAPSLPADLAQVEGAVACIEGASTMYKNSPQALKPSILPALKAALVAAVDTCSSAAGITEAVDYAAGVPGTIEQIDGVIACIDGAVTMYKNSPTNLKKDVVVALRAALVSAVSTCSSVIGDNAAPPATAYQAPPTVEAPAAPAPVAPVLPVVVEAEPEPEPVGNTVAIPTTEPASSAAETTEREDPLASMGPDANSKVLNGIFENIKAASGGGNLGLRSDLTSSEASKLADELVEMRRILMDELDAGISVAGTPAQKAVVVEASSAPADTGSASVSKYQQMLARAKKQKTVQAD